jgi:hypothetical protein
MNKPNANNMNLVVIQHNYIKLLVIQNIIHLQQSKPKMQNAKPQHKKPWAKKNLHSP